jgi:hypothetical protein
MAELRTESFDGGDVLAIALDPDGVWAYSKFPHPLVTADYDADDRLIGIVAVGPAAVEPLGELLEGIVRALAEQGSRSETSEARDVTMDLQEAARELAVID